MPLQLLPPPMKNNVVGRNSIEVCITWNEPKNAPHSTPRSVATPTWPTDSDTCSLNRKNSHQNKAPPTNERISRELQAVSSAPCCSTRTIAITEFRPTLRTMSPRPGPPSVGSTRSWSHTGMPSRAFRRSSKTAMLRATTKQNHLRAARPCDGTLRG
jgi:hypothetical protein